jgi:putative transposase
MMEEDAVQLCGPRYGRKKGKAGHRWGKTKGKLSFHGGKVELERPRIRARNGTEMSLPSWEEAASNDLLGKWAMNLMLINVSTRKYGRAVRLPEGGIGAPSGSGVSKSAVSRRFVALSAVRMKEWMAADLSKLDLLVIQIDGIHIKDDLMLLAAVGVDGQGGKHPLGVVEGAAENAAVAQALLDNLMERGLDPKVCRLFVIDGAKTLSKAIRKTSDATRRSSAAKSTRPAISWSACQVSATRRAQAIAAGVGIGRCGESREASAQSCPPPGPRRPWRFRQHSGRAG